MGEWMEFVGTIFLLLFLALYGGLAVALFANLLRDVFLRTRSAGVGTLKAATELPRQDRMALSWFTSIYKKERGDER